VEINRVMTGNESEKKISARNTAIYGRVSSHEQKKKGISSGRYSGEKNTARNGGTHP